MVLFYTSIPAQDDLKNIAELSMPLTDKKLVIAHCMTNIVRYNNHPFEDGCNSQYYSPENNATSSIGGYTQVKAMTDEWMKNASLDEAVEFEMKAALKAGIDGFQFYYTLNPASDDIIKAYFRVADKKNIDFKFTFCISHPSGSTEEKKINAFAGRINGILDEVRRDNKHWLRTPDGRLIIYLWYGEQIADIPAAKTKLPNAYYEALAFKKLSTAVKDNFACVYLINENISDKKLDEYLDYFPAVWVWTLTWKKDYIGKKVADACKRRGRTFTGSVFCDFYTSKLLTPGTWDILKANDAVTAGVKGLERKALVTGLSYNFRKLLEFNLDRDVSLMNVITWNDYPEGHHLAPEENHNDGFSVLLQYYKSVWKKEPSPYQNKDIALVFFKKYKHNIQPSPYNIPLIFFQEGTGKPASEDFIEVVTILKHNATVTMNNKTVSVGAGLSTIKFDYVTGPVKINIERDKKPLLEFITPEVITDRPVRTDRLTYSYTSETKIWNKELQELANTIQNSNTIINKSIQ